MEDILLFDEYVHTDNDRGVMHPYLMLTGTSKGQWFLTGWTYPITFPELIALCNIPEDEAILMKLKHGG